MVTDQVIEARIVGERADVMDALVRVAHLEGAQDNITIIVADVVSGEPEGEPEPLGAASRIRPDAAGEPTLVGIDQDAAVRRPPRARSPATPRPVATAAPCGSRSSSACCSS